MTDVEKERVEKYIKRYSKEEFVNDEEYDDLYEQIKSIYRYSFAVEFRKYNRDLLGHIDIDDFHENIKDFLTPLFSNSHKKLDSKVGFLELVKCLVNDYHENKAYKDELVFLNTKTLVENAKNYFVDELTYDIDEYGVLSNVVFKNKYNNKAEGEQCIYALTCALVYCYLTNNLDKAKVFLKDIFDRGNTFFYCPIVPYFVAKELVDLGEDESILLEGMKMVMDNYKIAIETKYIFETYKRNLNEDHYSYNADKVLSNDTEISSNNTCIVSDDFSVEISETYKELNALYLKGKLEYMFFRLGSKGVYEIDMYGRCIDEIYVANKTSYLDLGFYRGKLDTTVEGVDGKEYCQAISILQKIFQATFRVPHAVRCKNHEYPNNLKFYYKRDIESGLKEYRELFKNDPYYHYDDLVDFVEGSKKKKINSIMSRMKEMYKNKEDPGGF